MIEYRKFCGIVAPDGSYYSLSDYGYSEHNILLSTLFNIDKETAYNANYCFIYYLPFTLVDQKRILKTNPHMFYAIKNRLT